MFSAWSVGIRLIATSNFGLIANGISREAARAEKSVGGLKRQVNTIGAGGTGKAAAGMNAINAGATRAESRVAALKGTMAVADRSMQAFGLVSAATFAIGIKGAADLQDSMAQTAIAMGRSTSYVESNFTGIATAMSMRTAQSVAQSMGILRTMATSGLNDPKELKSLAMPIAMYADTQYLLKGTDFNQSAAIATKVAHGFGARTSAELTPILNSLFKISNDMPDSMSAMATQLKYYAPKFVEKGVSAKEVLMLQATADRMGYGTGKSGTGFLQIYRNLLNPTTKHMARAQHALGIDGYSMIDKSGKFDPEKLFNRLNTLNNIYHNRGDGKAFDEMLNAAFTSNAGLIAGVISSNAGRAQYENVKQTMNRVKDMEPAQAQAMATLSKQTILLISNFKTLATFIAQPWIKPFTDAIGSAAKAIGNLAIYMKDHQTVAKVTGGVMMGAAAYFAVRMAMAGRKFYDFFATLGKHPNVGVIVGKGSGWGRKAATVAAEGAGVIAKRSIVGRVAVGAAEAIGLGGSFKLLGGIKPMFGAIAKLGELFTSFGLKTLTTRGGLMLLGEVVAKIGLRAIPVIGEVLLLIDVVRFLGTHAKDIGKGIGIAAKWIVAHGVPMIIGAFKSILFGLWDLIKNWAGYMKDSYAGLLRGMFTGDFHGGIIDTLKGFGDGLKQGWNKEDNDKRYNEQHRIDADRKKAAPLGTNPALHGPKLTTAVLPVAQMKATPPNAVLPSANPFTLSPNLTQPVPRAESPHRERTRAVSHHVHVSVKTKTESRMNPAMPKVLVPPLTAKATPPTATPSQPASIIAAHTERTREIVHPVNVAPKLTILTPRTPESHPERMRAIPHPVNPPVSPNLNLQVPKLAESLRERTRAVPHPASVITTHTQRHTTHTEHTERTRSVAHPVNVSLSPKLNLQVPKLPDTHREPRAVAYPVIPVLSPKLNLQVPKLPDIHREPRSVAHPAIPALSPKLNLQVPKLPDIHREPRSVAHPAIPALSPKLNLQVPKLPDIHREPRSVAHPAIPALSPKLNLQVPKLPDIHREPRAVAYPVIHAVSPKLNLQVPKLPDIHREPRSVAHPVNVLVQAAKPAPLGTNPALHGPKLTTAALPAAQMKAASPNLTQPAPRAENPHRAIAHPVTVSVQAAKPAPLAHRREQTREVAHTTAPVIQFHYHAPATGDQAAHERALLNTQRKLADTVSDAFAKTLRTSGRAAGQAPAMAGASGFEFAGSPG